MNNLVFSYFLFKTQRSSQRTGPTIQKRIWLYLFSHLRLPVCDIFHVEGGELGGEGISFSHDVMRSSPAKRINMLRMWEINLKFAPPHSLDAREWNVLHIRCLCQHIVCKGNTNRAKHQREGYYFFITSTFASFSFVRLSSKQWSQYLSPL